MINKLNLEHILFLDIETVPETQHFSDLDATKNTPANTASAKLYVI
mgnify:CR=1 FL=1